MTPSILLDYLISQSNENTLHFSFETCPLSLVKETILRGYQIRHYGEHIIIDETFLMKQDLSFREGCGISVGKGTNLGYGCGHEYGTSQTGNGNILVPGWGESPGNTLRDRWNFVEKKWERGYFSSENFNPEIFFYYPYHTPNPFSRFSEYVEEGLPYYL